MPDARRRGANTAFYIPVVLQKALSRIDHSLFFLNHFFLAWCCIYVLLTEGTAPPDSRHVALLRCFRPPAILIRNIDTLVIREKKRTKVAIV